MLGLACFHQISKDVIDFLHFQTHFHVCFFHQRKAKYSENKLKTLKARNEYLLTLEATNASVFKYYIHDLPDIIDVSIHLLHVFITRQVGACRNDIWAHFCIGHDISEGRAAERRQVGEIRRVSDA